MRHAIAFLLFFCGTNIVFAQADCPSSPTTLSPDQLKECLKQISELKGQISTLASSVAQLQSLAATTDSQKEDPLSGAIVAFATSCPKGWVPYAEATGRFILGAGGSHALGVPGGSDVASLGRENTPPHLHVFQGKTVTIYGYAAAPGNTLAAGHPTVSLGGSFTPEGAVLDSGEGKSFSIMPPFIALTFCKRGGS